MKLYMACENNEYELPVAVAESKTELAKMLGRDISCVSNAIKRSKTVKHPTGEYRWAEVEVEDD